MPEQGQLLEELPWHFFGGSYFGKTGRRKLVALLDAGNRIAKLLAVIDDSLNLVP